MSNQDIGEDWMKVFEYCKRNENEPKLTFTIEDFRPIFLWRNTKKGMVKSAHFIHPPFMGKYNQITSELTISGSSLIRFKLFVQKFTSIIKEIKPDENKWKIFKKKTKTKNKQINYTKEFENHFDILSNPISDSLFIKINLNPDEKGSFRIFPLFDGQGICYSNNKIHIVDNGRGIHVFNEETLSLEQSLYSQEIFNVSGIYKAPEVGNKANCYFITKKLKNQILKLETETTNENLQKQQKASINIPSPTSVRIGMESIVYVLTTTGLFGIIQMEDDDIILLLTEKIRECNFSDFTILQGEFAILLDSFQGKLYKYSFLESKLDEINIHNEKLKNPQGICSIEEFPDQILISDTNNCVIKRFQLVNFSSEAINITNYNISPFSPNKLTANKNSIYFTANKVKNSKRNEIKRITVKNSGNDDHLPLNSDYDWRLTAEEFDTLLTDTNPSNFNDFGHEISEKLNHFLLCQIKELFSFPFSLIEILNKKYQKNSFFSNQIHKKNQNFNFLHSFLPFLYSNDILLFLYHFLVRFSNDFNDPNQNHLKIQLKVNEKLINHRKNDFFGLIVLIFDDFFTFSSTDYPIRIGTICDDSDVNSIDFYSISLWGSVFVKVIIPECSKIDSRGMFVILDKKNVNGIGRIVSFYDLCNLDKNNYYFVGVCCIENDISLILYDFDKTRISFPISNYNNHFCLVSVMLPPISSKFFDFCLSKFKLFDSFPNYKFKPLETIKTTVSAF